MIHILIFHSPEKLREYQTLLRRGLNTWDSPPDWLLRESDRVDAKMRVPSVVTTPFFAFEIKPVHVGVYRAFHLTPNGRKVGWARWYPQGWGLLYPSQREAEAETGFHPEAYQNKFWQGVLR